MSEPTDPVIADSKAPPTSVEAPPNALEMILDWSKGLPDWQSDAVRRILQQRELSSEDEQEILTVLKATQEGLTAQPPQKSPKRLDKEHLPPQANPGKKVVLEYLKDLHNVNALVPGQTIKFQPNGLTIVFGRNATGKSGYTRVLKKACRARGDKKPILPNVFSNPPAKGPALATIGIHDGDRPIPVSWQDGKPSHEELGRITVFDAHCARVYVDEANDVFYVPYGLDVFDKLAKLCDKLKGTLQHEIETISTDRKFLEDLEGDTSVGQAIKRLSYETAPTTIEALGTFSEADAQRLSEAEKRLAEIKVSDPKAKARHHRLTKDRILRLADSLREIEAGLSASATEEIRMLQTEAEEARKAAQIASQRSFEKEPLIGVGSELWRTLLLAAKEYSEQLAYNGEAFPVTRDGARCVLCFQELGPEAAGRLRRFWDFIEGAAQKVYRCKSEDLQKRITAVRNLQIAPADADPLLRELDDVDGALAQEVREYLKSAQERREDLLRCIAGNSWNPLSSPTAAPIDRLRQLAGDQENLAAEFDRMSITAEKEKLETAFGELDAKKRLASRKDAVFSLLNNLRRVKKIESCIAATDTTGISRTSTKFMELLVTDRLRSELRKELELLDAGYLELELSKIGRLGVTLYRHRLKSETHGAVSVSDVMSESEQRAIALASFLAELNISHENSGVIFDDPVSSLDYQRQKKVAVRLAKEANKRQVAVFTHDMVFLSALQEAALKEDVAYSTQTLWATRQAGPGNCDPNPPWAGQTVKDRLGYLKGTLLPELRSLSKDPHKKKECDAAATEFVKKLRQTWERTIEELVLGSAVMRFRDSIEPARLGSVQFTDVEDQTIADAMERLSAHLHDEASAHGGSPLPDPDELEREVDALETFIKEIRDKQKVIKANRPWRKKLT